MNSSILLLLAVMGSADGKTIALYDSTDSCDYGWWAGAYRNSAGLTLAPLCWRLSRETGRIIVQNHGDVPMEDFDWSDTGWAWIRKELR